MRTAFLRPNGSRKCARAWRCEDGQSLIETAVFLPLLILLIAYAIDFGYFFFVAVNLATATRGATEYSIQGYNAPGQTSLPPAGPMSNSASIAGLASADLSGLASYTTATSVQVCSKQIGVTSNGVAECTTYGSSGGSYTPARDPEAPTFVLQRVDVTYTVQPPIPLNFFSLSLMPSLNFHRQVSMRALD